MLGEGGNPMALDLSTINWLAVVVAAAIYFFLGALWYSPPLFARQWQESIGWDPAARGQIQANPMTYVIPAVLYLIAAIATALLAAATGTDTLTEGLTLGLVTGLGYALPMLGVEASFDPNKPKPLAWFVISLGYHLIGFVILGVVIGLWQ
jgi:hypothetical protein